MADLIGAMKISLFFHDWCYLRSLVVSLRVKS